MATVYAHGPRALLCTLALSLLMAPALSLLNGAALTPPLGWVSWMRYRCTVSCNDSTSADCLNEKLVRDVADAMVAGGYKDAGYEYVNLDDCWQAPRRVNGHVVADPHRFPSGMKALADYVHAKGLKLGLYTAQGNLSCSQIGYGYGVDPLGLDCDYGQIAVGCPTAKRDIDDFVSWGIDHLKVDGCGGFDKSHQNHSYALVGRYLAQAATARGTGPVVYHPSNLALGFPRQFRELAAIANQWRIYDDICAAHSCDAAPGGAWASVAGIIEQIGAGQPDCSPGPLPANCSGLVTNPMAHLACSSNCEERDAFLRAPGTGGWHDPDMLLVGNTACSAAAAAAGLRCFVVPAEVERTQFALWSMASAALLFSNDLPRIPERSRAILLNREVLRINQDPLGRMCFRFKVDDKTGAQMWRKDLLGGDVAVAIVNMGDAPLAPGHGFELDEVGFAPDTRVLVRDLYEGATYETVGRFLARTPVVAHDTLLLRLTFAPFDSGLELGRTVDGLLLAPLKSDDDVLMGSESSNFIMKPAATTKSDSVSSLQPAMVAARWGTNVHWVECSLHKPCPSSKDLGPGGGPKCGEVKQLGAAFRWARTGIRWYLVEQTRGVYNFTMYEQLLDELDSAGVRLYGIFADGNPLYNCTYAPRTAPQQEAFARFCVAMMAHFRKRDVIWELWNEPNAQKINASTYASLLRAVGSAARGNPLAKAEMLVGPTTSGISLSYIGAIAATGALQYLDAVSVHPYRAGPPESVLRDYADLRDVLKHHSCGHLAIFSSEWGYGACKDANGTAAPCTTPTLAPRADDVVTEREQASRLARMWLINDAANVSLSIWYEWINDVVDGVEPLVAESNFGAVHRDYLNGSGDTKPRREKPTYHAAQTLQQLLGMRVPVGAECDTAEGTYAVRYSDPGGVGGDSWAVWLTNSSARHAKCDHRPNMCCKYSNQTIIPGCASREGCAKRGCCWDDTPGIPGYWCSHPNPPPGQRNASVLPFTLPGCRNVFDLFGNRTSRICPTSDSGSGHASTGGGGESGVMLVWGEEFVMTTDPQYLLPTPGQVDDHVFLKNGSSFCFTPDVGSRTLASPASGTTTNSVQ